MGRMESLYDGHFRIAFLVLKKRNRAAIFFSIVYTDPIVGPFRYSAKIGKLPIVNPHCILFILARWVEQVWSVGKTVQDTNQFASQIDLIRDGGISNPPFPSLPFPSHHFPSIPFISYAYTRGSERPAQKPSVSIGIHQRRKKSRMGTFLYQSLEWWN